MRNALPAPSLVSHNRRCIYRTRAHVSNTCAYAIAIRRVVSARQVDAEASATAAAAAAVVVVEAIFRRVLSITRKSPTVTLIRTRGSQTLVLVKDSVIQISAEKNDGDRLLYIIIISTYT